MGCQPQKPTDHSERNRHQNKSLGKTEFPHGRVRNLLFWKGKTYVLPSPCSWRQTVPSSTVAILAVKHRPGIPERDDAERSWAWWKLMRNTNHHILLSLLPPAFTLPLLKKKAFFPVNLPDSLQALLEMGPPPPQLVPLAAAPRIVSDPFLVAQTPAGPCLQCWGGGAHTETICFHRFSVSSEKIQFKLFQGL